MSIGRNAVLGNRRPMAAIFAAMQNAAVNLRMQRLDAPIEHFREAGQFRNIFDGDAGIAQQLGRASGRNQFDAESGELAGKVDQSGFIGDTKNGALNFRHETSGANQKIGEERF